MTDRVSGNLTSHQKRFQKRQSVALEMLPQKGSLKLGGQPTIAIDYSDTDVIKYNERLIAILEELRLDVQKRPMTEDELDLAPLPDDLCRQYLRKLRNVGAEAYSRLPLEVGEALNEMEESAAGMGRGISLDIRFPPEMAFLWEMMYMGEIEGDVNPEMFWGYRYPIGNLYWKTPELLDAVALGAGLFASMHGRLSHSADELKLIREQVEKVRDRLGLEVSAVSLEEKAQEIFLAGEQAEEPGDPLLKYFHCDEFAYGLVHFACHCVNPDDVNMAHLLITAGSEQIPMRLGRFHVFAKRGFHSRPLVFLNACESGTPVHLLQASNFPKAFINFGAGGVIATTCTMPDNFATAFAAQFYQRLLDCPSNQPAYIGAALLDTRLYFLKEKNNPLGLAYSLYTLADQELVFHSPTVW